MPSFDVLATAECAECETTVGPICPKCRANMVVDAKDLNEDGWIDDEEIAKGKWRCLGCGQDTWGVCPLCRNPIGRSMRDAESVPKA